MAEKMLVHIDITMSCPSDRAFFDKDTIRLWQTVPGPPRGFLGSKHAGLSCQKAPPVQSFMMSQPVMCMSKDLRFSQQSCAERVLSCLTSLCAFTPQSIGLPSVTCRAKYYWTIDTYTRGR